MSTRIFILIFFAQFIFACGPTSGEATQSTGNEEFVDFAEFYERFHKDSLFQISRIDFPLSGLPSNADSSHFGDQPFFWQLEDWRMHQRIDFNQSEFEQKLTAISEDVIIEDIIHQSGQYAIKRYFTRWDDGWHLTQYIGLNPINPNQTGDPQIKIERGF